MASLGAQTHHPSSQAQAPVGIKNTGSKGSTHNNIKHPPVVQRIFMQQWMLNCKTCCKGRLVHKIVNLLFSLSLPPPTCRVRNPNLSLCRSKKRQKRHPSKVQLLRRTGRSKHSELQSQKSEGLQPNSELCPPGFAKPKSMIFRCSESSTETTESQVVWVDHLVNPSPNGAQRPFAPGEPGET